MNKAYEAIAIMMRAENSCQVILENRAKCLALQEAICVAAEYMASENQKADMHTIKEDRYFVFDLKEMREICSENSISISYGVKFQNYEELSRAIRKVRPEYPRKYFLFSFLKTNEGDVAMNDAVLEDFVKGFPFRDGSLDGNEAKGVNRYVLGLHWSMNTTEYNEELTKLLNDSFYEMYPDLKSTEEYTTD